MQTAALNYLLLLVHFECCNAIFTLKSHAGKLLNIVLVHQCMVLCAHVYQIVYGINSH